MHFDAVIVQENISLVLEQNFHTRMELTQMKLHLIYFLAAAVLIEFFPLRSKHQLET